MNKKGQLGAIAGVLGVKNIMNILLVVGDLLVALFLIGGFVFNKIFTIGLIVFILTAVLLFIKQIDFNKAIYPGIAGLILMLNPGGLFTRKFSIGTASFAGTTKETFIVIGAVVAVLAIIALFVFKKK